MSGEYVGWTPPPGVGVVSPPVHPETVVSVIYSDAHVDEDEYFAHRLNWSSVGDGPSIVAYAVVSEYKPAPEPREWWMLRSNDIMIGAWRNESHTKTIAREYTSPEIIHVREVLPAAREVVAWAVVFGPEGNCYWDNEGETDARQYAKLYGGTVVRLSGVMP